MEYSGTVRARCLSRAFGQSLENFQDLIVYGDCDDVKRGPVMELILMKLCGETWATISRAVHLFPLRFADRLAEQDYGKWTQDLYRSRGIVVAGLSSVVFGIIWINMFLLWNNGEATIPPLSLRASFHTIVGVTELINVSFGVRSYISRLRSNPEHALHLMLTLEALLFFVWCGLYLRCINGAPNGATDSSLLYARILVEWILTCKVTFLAVSLNFYLPARTKHTFPMLVLIILAIWGCRIAADVASLTAPIQKAGYCESLLSTMLLIMCWCARWLRELTDRLTTMQIMDSARRVERARRLRAFAAQTGPASVMEVCVSLLELTRTILSRNLRSADHSVLLDDVKETLTGALLYLTSGKSVLAHTTKLKQDEEDQEEMQFVEAFKNPIANNWTASMKLSKGESFHKSKVTTVLLEDEFENGTQTSEGSSDVSQKQSTGVRVRFKFEPMIGEDPQFDALSFLDQSPEMLVSVGSALLRPFVARGYLRCDTEVINNMLICLGNLYWRSNPFHNEMHAANSAHFYALLLKYLQLNNAPEQETMAGIVAALGHDVGHPGRNSNFYQRTNSMMSVVYSDDSVMENAHGSTLIRFIMTCPETNIFEGLTAVEVRDIRRLIVELILATDIMKHFEYMSNFRLCAMSPDFDYKQNPEHRKRVYHLCIKAADAFFGCLEWSSHKEWVLRSCEERYQQGQDEKTMLLSPSPWCNREAPEQVPQFCMTYLDRVLTPILTELGEISNDERINHFLLKETRNNRATWQSLSAAKLVTGIPVHLRKMQIAPSDYLLIIVSHIFRSQEIKSLGFTDYSALMRKELLHDF